ncbi:hypothetical protein LINPERPRIM_LOCUS25138, partial [Linum perenne]
FIELIVYINRFSLNKSKLSLVTIFSHHSIRLYLMFFRFLSTAAFFLNMMDYHLYQISFLFKSSYISFNNM